MSENKNEPIVEIINELRNSYEDYRLTHKKEEIEDWVRKFKDKYKTQNLNIDIYFSKAWGGGPTELEKMNILFKERSNQLYYYANKRTTGGYYIIISDLHKDKVNIRIDFSNELKDAWYNKNNKIGELIEKEIYTNAFEDLKGKGISFEYINSNETSYFVNVSNQIVNYVNELKKIINNYPDIMREYLDKHKELSEKYEELYNEKVHRNQGKLFTKYVWTLVYEKMRLDPIIGNNDENQIESNNKNDVKVNNNKEYNFMNEDELNKIIELLEYKKNIILEGIPGVGKTYIAKKIANQITSNKEDNIKIVQFHQSYAYEDFVQGLRPTNNSTFEPVDGILKTICDKARKEINDKFVIIIDEINRGNISKIFGETFMLIEKDKRITKVQIEKNKNSKYAVVLPYSEDKNSKFDIPENVYFIGTMNTMDKSISIMDFALRRRFSMYEIKPCFDNGEFKRYISDVNNKKLEILVKRVKSINDSKNLDGIKFGHSYFCGLNNCENLDKIIDFIINYEILPQLREYLLGDNKKIKKLDQFLNSSDPEILSVDKILTNANDEDDETNGE